MLRGREESVLLVREREWCQCENEFGKRVRWEREEGEYDRELGGV